LYQNNNNKQQQHTLFYMVNKSGLKQFSPLIVLSIIELLFLIVLPIVFIVTTSIGSTRDKTSNNSDILVSRTNPFSAIWWSIVTLCSACIHLFDVWYDVPLRKLLAKGDSKYARKYSVWWLVVRVMISLLVGFVIALPTLISYCFGRGVREWVAGVWAGGLLGLSFLVIVGSVFKFRILRRSGHMEDVSYLVDLDDLSDEDADEDLLASNSYYDELGGWYENRGSSQMGLTARVHKRSIVPKVTTFRVCNCVIQSIMLLLVLLLSIGTMLATVQAIWMFIEGQSVHMPGTIYRIHNGKQRMHMLCKGAPNAKNGTNPLPTVIIESGLGVESPTVYWNDIQNQLALLLIRVCVYDRAGVGWSDAGAYPRDSNSIVNDLKQLLDKAGEKGPFVLVGHSFGGYNVRVFTSQYPDQVSGLMLVDSSHENQQAMMWKAQNISESAGKKEQAKQDMGMNFMRVFAPFGFYRYAILSMNRFMLNPYNQTLSTTQRKIKEFSMFENKFISTLWSEASNFPTKSASEVRQSRASGYGDLPLVVLTAGYTMNGTCADNHMPPKSSMCTNFEKFKTENAQITMEMQADMASLSTNSVWDIIWNSSHNIAIDQPGILVQHIVNLVQKAANYRSLTQR